MAAGGRDGADVDGEAPATTSAAPSPGETAQPFAARSAARRGRVQRGRPRRRRSPAARPPGRRRRSARRRSPAAGRRCARPRPAGATTAAPCRRAAACPRSSAAHPADALRVQPVGRLVEHQHRRVGQQRAGDAEPLPHAQRVAARSGVRRRRSGPTSSSTSSTRDAGTPMAAASSRRCVRPVRPGCTAPASSSVPITAPGLGSVGVRPAVHERGARGRRHQAGDHAHRRRLAGAVRAEEAGHRAGLQRERDVVDDGPAAVLLGQSADLDHRRPPLRPASPVTGRTLPGTRRSARRPEGQTCGHRTAGRVIRKLIEVAHDRPTRPARGPTYAPRMRLRARIWPGLRVRGDLAGGAARAARHRRRRRRRRDRRPRSAAGRGVRGPDRGPLRPAADPAPPRRRSCRSCSAPSCRCCHRRSTASCCCSPTRSAGTSAAGRCGSTAAVTGRGRAWPSRGRAATRGDQVSRWLGGIVLVVLPGAIGVYVRTRALLLPALRERAERAEGERELLAREAVLTERTRIAREMHDAVGHRVSLMVLQAGAIEMAAADRQRVVQLAGQVQTAGRQALDELRQMVGVLRAERRRRGRRRSRPQPGWPTCPRWSRSRGAGHGRRAAMPPRGAPVEPAAGRAAYRMVQEALTNAGKHAPGAAVRRGGGAAGRPARRPGGQRPAARRADRAPGGGYGLVGLAERVRTLGGQLHAGPRLDGGFRGRGGAAGVSDDPRAARRRRGAGPVRAAHRARGRRRLRGRRRGGDGATGVRAARELRPDVVLIDIRMPVMDGLAATRQILALPDPPQVAVLTTFHVDEYVYAALRRGRRRVPAQGHPAARDRRRGAGGGRRHGDALPRRDRRPDRLLRRTQRPRRGAPPPWAGWPSCPTASARCCALLGTGESNAELGQAAVHQRGDGEDLGLPAAHQAGPGQPHPGGDPGPRGRPAGGLTVARGRALA